MQWSGVRLRVVLLAGGETLDTSSSNLFQLVAVVGVATRTCLVIHRLHLSTDSTLKHPTACCSSACRRKRNSTGGQMCAPRTWGPRRHTRGRYVINWRQSKSAKLSFYQILSPVFCFAGNFPTAPSHRRALSLPQKRLKAD